MIVLGFALSAIFLWAAFNQVNAREFFHTLSMVTVWPLVLVALAMVLGMFLRAVRWRLLSGERPEMQRFFTSATILGVFFNFIFPARAGELIRIALLHKLLRTPLSRVISSSFADRVTDVLVLASTASGLYLFTPIGNLIGGWLSSLVLFIGVIALVVVVTSRRVALGQFIARRLMSNWHLRWPTHTLNFLGKLRADLGRCFRRTLSIKIIALIILVLGNDYLIITAIFGAFSLNLPSSAPLVLWVFFAAGSALPSAPGYVGIYQLAAVWALSLYETPAAIAVGVATVIQVMTLVVGGVSAGIALLRIKHRHSIVGEELPLL